MTASWRESPFPLYGSAVPVKVVRTRDGRCAPGFLVAAPPLTVLAEPGSFASRISRRDWWPDQDTTGELDIITGSQESGEVIHRAGMNFFCPSAETSSPMPVASSSNSPPCKDEWFLGFRDQETER